MKHPTSIEIVDYRKGKLPSERAQEIEKHLSVCDSCLQAWEELEAVEAYLAAWEDPPVSEAFAEDAIQTIMCNETTHDLNLTGDLNDGWRGNLWFRRIVLAAGAVAATLLFQALVWNPLATPTTFRTILNLVPQALALTSEQAVPDTILVLTLYPDNTFSTSLLTGQYELEDLITELGGLVEKGRFKELFIVGTDIDNPVTFKTEKLQPLLEKLGIDSFTIGTGVVALETARELTATITLPLQMHRSLRSSLQITGIEPLVVSHVIQPTLPLIHLDPITLELTTHKLRLTPTVRVTPTRVRVRTRDYPDASLLADLLAPSQAVLTVNPDGTVLIDRAVIPEEELERSLRRLHLLNPGISLLILVREDAGPDDPGYRVMRIARRLGMSVSVKKVRDP